MVNFTKILGLAGAAAVFSGLAYGQATCGAPVALNLGIIRAEGTTEQVSQLQFSTVHAGFTASAAGTGESTDFHEPGAADNQ